MTCGQSSSGPDPRCSRTRGRAVGAVYPPTSVNKPAVVVDVAEHRGVLKQDELPERACAAVERQDGHQPGTHGRGGSVGDTDVAGVDGPAACGSGGAGEIVRFGLAPYWCRPGLIRWQ